MAKGYQAFMFLVMLNLSFGVLGGLGVFSEGSIPATADIDNPISEDLLLVFTSLVTGGSAVGLALATRSMTPLALGAFASVFIVQFMSIAGIIKAYGISDDMLVFIMVPIGFVFVISLIQMAAGISMRGMA